MSNVLLEHVLRRLRDERLRRGFSVSEVAERVGMDERNFRRIEKGESKDVGLCQLARIAESLGTSVQALLPEEELYTYALRQKEAPRAINTVISIADAIAFFRGMYAEHIANQEAVINQLQQHERAQSHIITALTGELEETREQLRMFRSKQRTHDPGNA